MEHNLSKTLVMIIILCKGLNSLTSLSSPCQSLSLLLDGSISARTLKKKKMMFYLKWRKVSLKQASPCRFLLVRFPDISHHQNGLADRGKHRLHHFRPSWRPSGVTTHLGTLVKLGTLLWDSFMWSLIFFGLYNLGPKLVWRTKISSSFMVKTI